MSRHLYLLTGDDTEPHVSVWRFGACLFCGSEGAWLVVAVAKATNGWHFPHRGACEVCEHEVDLRGLSPFYPFDVREWAYRVGVLRLKRDNDGAPA